MMQNVGLGKGILAGCWYRVICSGVLSFIYKSQKVSSSLQLNVHFHILVIDGVFMEEADGVLTFLPGRKPTPCALQRVVSKIAEKVITVLRERGEAVAERIAESAPTLSEFAALSVEGQRGPSMRGRRGLEWLVDPLRAMERGEPPLDVADCRGFNLHAGVRIAEYSPKKRLSQASEAP